MVLLLILQSVTHKRQNFEQPLSIYIPVAQGCFCDISMQVDQHADKLRLDKRVAPLPTRADSLAKQRRDRRLEASIVATVGAAIVPTIGEFAFCSP